MIGLEKAAEVIAGISHMKYFPTDPAARASLAEIVSNVCGSDEDADELVRRMVFDAWPGAATLVHVARQITGVQDCPLCNGRRFRVVCPDGRRISAAAAVQRGLKQLPSENCACVKCAKCSDDGFVYTGSDVVEFCPDCRGGRGAAA